MSEAWEGLGSRRIPPREMAEMEARTQYAAIASRAYELWRELEQLARENHWTDAVRLLGELELVLPDPEDF